MDSDSFTPSGQGSPNNMTPQSNSEPTPPPTPEPTSGPNPAPTPNPLINPAPAPEPEPTPNPTPEPTLSSEPAVEPTPTAEPSPTLGQPTPEGYPEQTTEPPRKPVNPIIVFCISAVILIIVVIIIFFIPLGDGGTLWNKIVGEYPSQGGSGGTGGSTGGTSSTYKTGDTVTTGDYTYTANLDLEYEPRGVFHDGLMKAISKDGDIVYLDTSGNVAFTLVLSYEPKGDFSDGLLAVRCNANRTKVKPTISGGYAMDSVSTIGREAAENRTYGYLDKTGNLVIPCQYSKVEEFKNGYASVTALQDKDLQNSKSIIDTKGQTVVPSGSYSNIVYEDNTFKDDTFKAAYLTNSELNEYNWGCFNLNGEQLEVLADDSGTCAEDTEKEAIKTSIEAKFNSNDYHVGTPSEGLTAISQQNPISMFFVDDNGDTVWTVDIDKVIDADEDEYTEGLIPLSMWVGDGERPDIQTMMDGGLSDEELYRNAGTVFYDHSGKPVFIYRYSQILDNTDN